MDRQRRGDKDTAQPGVFPGVRQTAGTMFAALYGELVPHEWRGPDPGGDAYSLFHQRSLAMGWLDDRRGGSKGDEVGAAGLWGMNDAGWDHPLVPAEARLTSWFQVEVEALADDGPLPVQPFLRCVGDTVNRAGRLHLGAVQILLPVQGIDVSSRPPYAHVPSMRTIYWFREGDPRWRTRVEVSVNSGQDPVIPAVAQQLTDNLRDLSQDVEVFVCTSYDVSDPEAVLARPFDDGSWNGPPLHGVTLRGELSEWSLDAIGWLAEVIADSSALLGVHAPLLLTVTRPPR